MAPPRKSIARWIAGQVAAGDREVAGDGRPGGEDDGVERGREIGRVEVRPDLDARLEGDPLGAQEVDPSLDELLGELHRRDPVHEQPADAVGPLEDGDEVARAG